MAERLHNLDMYKGDTKIIDITIVDRDGNAIDITSSEIRFTVKKRATYPDSKKIFQKITPAINGIDITDATAGEFRVTINPADTDASAVTAGGYVYDCQIKLSDGSVYTVVTGQFRINQDVTRTY